MSLRETYSVVDLGNGDKCELIMPIGGDYSRAMQKYSQQKAYDLSVHLMAEICRIDEEIRDITYFLQLGCDDYLKILEVLNHLLVPIK